MKPYPLYKTTFYRGFSELLKDRAKVCGCAPAITCYTADGTALTYSYAQIDEDAHCAADAFYAKGFTQKHVALVGGNSYEWLVAFLGAVIAGNCVALIDTEQPTEMVRNMIRYADTDVLFVADSMRGVVDSGQDTTLFSLEREAFAAFCKGEETAREHGARQDGTVLVFTSGTTSAPKAVELSAEGILANAAESIAMVQGTPKIYSPLPLYHIYGLTCGVIANMIAGAHICVNGDVKTMLRDLCRFQPGTVMAVPLLAEQLYRMLWQAARSDGLQKREKKHFFQSKKSQPPAEAAVALKKKLLGDVQLIVCGGAHLSEEVGTGLAAFGILALQGYGITECSPLVSVNRNLSNKMDTVGMLLPGYEIRMGENGEIQLRGKSLMLGYYKQEQLTRDAFSDGWFKTGDIGSVDKHGYLRISGRIKNLIVMKNGKKISPEEMERYLEVLPFVKSVLVYGAATGDEADDVKIAALVYPDPELTAGMAAYEVLAAIQQKIEEVNKTLPMYQQIQIVNISEAEQKRTSLGKEKRRR